MTPKEDLFAVLDAVPGKFDEVRLAVVEGRINGLDPRLSRSTKCGCIKAHIAGDDYFLDREKLPSVARVNTESAIEKYVYSVWPGKNPQNCEVLKNVLEWLDEWNKGVDFSDDDGVDF